MGKKSFILLFFAGLLFSGCTPKKADQPAVSAAGGGIDRTVLPIKVPPRPTFTELDVRNVTAGTFRGKSSRRSTKRDPGTR